MNAGEAVVRRNRSGPRIPANRHSFYGFESTSLIQSREIAAESPPAKLRLPDTHFLNTNNLSSTPVSKVLHPLIEDDSPTSPFKSQKALFDKDLGKDEAGEISQNSVDLSSIIIEGSNDDFAENIINDQDSNEQESLQSSENTQQDVIDKDKNRNSIEISSNKNERVVAETAEEVQLSSHEEEENLVKDETIKIGDKINLGGDNTGQVRFVGKTEFADGMWAGVELTSPNGESL